MSKPSQIAAAAFAAVAITVLGCSHDLSGPGTETSGLPGRGDLGAACPASGRCTTRPVADWLKNNPYGFNFVHTKFLLNLGWNPHGFPDADGNLTAPANFGVFTGADPYGYPNGFSSILAAVNGPTTTTGQIQQIAENDGGVRLLVDLHIDNNPMSVYYRPDVEGPGGCSSEPFFTRGPGCNGDNEPPALLGQGPDGSWDYTLQVEMHYTPEAVQAAGGDLAAGVNPTIPFLLASLYGSEPGVTVVSAAWGGTGTGTFTDYAAGFGFTPGATGQVSVSYRYSAPATIPSINGPDADVTITQLP